MTWHARLREAGAAGTDWKSATITLAVQAAIVEQGVVLGRRAILRDLIVAGLLVNPCHDSVDPKIAYNPVTHPKALARPAVQNIVDWIVAESTHQNRWQLYWAS